MRPTPKATTSNGGDISNARVRMRNRMGTQAQVPAMMPTTPLGAGAAAPATNHVTELFYRLTALEALVERLEARNVRLEAMIDGYRTTGEWPSPAPLEDADPGDPGEEEAPADPGEGEPTAPDVPGDPEPDAPEDPTTVADPAVE